MACTDSRLVLTPGRRCRATSRFGATKLWVMSWRRGMPLASTASMTLFAYAGVESESGSPGTFLISRFTSTPARRAYWSSAWIVTIGAGRLAGRVGNGLPGLPSTSVRQPASSATVKAHLTGAVGGAVERRVVDSHRHAVLAELRVDLEHEPVAGSIPVRGEALLREARLAVHDRAAAVSVDVGCGREGRRRGHEDLGKRESQASDHCGRTIRAAGRHR